MLAELLNIDFPLLGSGFPIWLNSLAIWYVVLSGLSEVFICISAGFKLRDYNANDNKIAIVLDILRLTVLLCLGAQIFKFTYLYKWLYYLVNFIFLAVIMATEIGIVLLLCKYNYSKYMHNVSNYKHIMFSIRKDRCIGLIMLLIVLVLNRLYIYIYSSPNEFSIFVGVIIIVVSSICKHYYNRVFTCIVNYTKKTISEND